MPEPQPASLGEAHSTMPSPGDDREARRWPPVETVHSTLLGLAIAFVGFAPRTAPIFLVALAVLTSIEALRGGMSLRRSLETVFSQPLLLAALAFLSFAALSALWAFDPAFAFRSVLQAALLVLATGLVTGLMPARLASLPLQRHQRFVRAIPLGMALGLGFVLFEFATGNAISLALVSRFPELMGDNTKDFVREGARVVGFAPFYLDRNVAALALAMPGMLLAIRFWLDPVPAAWALGIAAMVAVAVLALSWSGAAKLGAVCALLTAIAVRRCPVLTRRLAFAALATGTLLALPLGQLPASLGLDAAAWLPPSTRERIVIWNRTAEAVQRAPVVGIGVQSTRFQPDSGSMHVEGIGGPRRELGWHAHNIVLQTWLELGAVGALLMLAIALAALMSAVTYAGHAASAGMALLAMVAAVGITGWGMWQPWLIAVTGIAIVAFRVAAAAGAPTART